MQDNGLVFFRMVTTIYLCSLMKSQFLLVQQRNIFTEYVIQRVPFGGSFLNFKLNTL